MAWELFAETPGLLRTGHVVHFSEKWAKEWAGKWFKVLLGQPISYDVTKIVAPGSGNTYDLDFGAPAAGDVSATYLSLLPTSPHTVYEILMGIKGLVAIYPRYNNSYWLKLETALCVPDPTDSRRKFLGAYRSIDSPYYEPRLRVHTIKDQTPPQLRLFNDFSMDESSIMRFIVNRCKVEEVYEGAISEQERRVAREVKHFDIFTW